MYTYAYGELSRSNTCIVYTYLVDGNDVLAVNDATRMAREYVVATSKPVLIEAKTYRYRGHSVSDAGLYRSKEEVAEYQARDPIETRRSPASRCHSKTPH